MDIIRVNQPSTFPITLREAILENKHVLEKYLNQEIEKSNSGVRCGLEVHNMYTDYELEELSNRVKELLEDYKFEGFHNTRIMRKSDLVNSGLLLLSRDSYNDLLRSTMTALNFDESIQNEIFNTLKEYLDNKHGNRTEMISFFTPYGIRSNYSKFTKNIGGEICDFGLSKTYPDVLEKLRSNGHPVTVRFAYSFRDVMDFKKDTIVLEILRHYAAKLIIEYDYPIEFDAILTKPVEPKDIFEIIDFIDIW